jgi:WD40 repeat protein
MSTSDDRMIKLRQTGTGEEQHLPTKHGSVTNVTFSPNGGLMSSFSWHHLAVNLWNTITGKQVRKLKDHSDGVNTVAFSPNSKLIASALKYQAVIIWDRA